MNKNEDALRAVTEYLQKPNISQIGLANLNRLQAFLLMISVDNNFIMASIKHFKTAQEIYHSLRMPNGVAICQLGILKIFHDKFEEIVAEMLPEQKDKLIKKCLNLINNSYELFVKFQSDNGKIQCKLIENSLNEKIKTKINSGKDLKSEQVTIHYSSMIHVSGTQKIVKNRQKAVYWYWMSKNVVLLCILSSTPFSRTRLLSKYIWLLRNNSNLLLSEIWTPFIWEI